MSDLTRFALENDDRTVHGDWTFQGAIAALAGLTVGSPGITITAGGLDVTGRVKLEVEGPLDVSTPSPAVQGSNPVTGTVVTVGTSGASLTGITLPAVEAGLLMLVYNVLNILEVSLLN